VTASVVVIADYDYGGVEIERGIVEDAGFVLRPLQCGGSQLIGSLPRIEYLGPTPSR